MALDASREEFTDLSQRTIDEMDAMVSEWLNPEHVHDYYSDRGTSPDYSGRFEVTPYCSCGKIMGVSIHDSIL